MLLKNPREHDSPCLFERLPEEVVVTSLAPLISPSKKHFSPLSFLTVDSKEYPIPKILHLLKSIPNVPHVQTLILTKQDDKTASLALELINLVGANLEHLTLHQEDLEQVDNLNPVLVGALHLCRNLRSLDLYLGDGSLEWWAFGGSIQLGDAIGKLSNLVGLSVTCNFNEDDDGYGDALDVMQQSPSFWVRCLQNLNAGQLTEKLGVQMGEHEDMMEVIDLITNQNAVKELSMTSPATNVYLKDVEEAEESRLFSDFARLEKLQVTIIGLVFFIPAFPHLENLRHLVISNVEHDEAWVSAHLKNTIKSGFLSRLESLSLPLTMYPAKDFAFEFFQLLGAGNALKCFSITCLEYEEDFDKDATALPNLDEILQSLSPSSTIESIHLNIHLPDSTFLLLAGFIARCENLQNLNITVNARFNVINNVVDQYTFLSNILSTPRLHSLSLPFPISSHQLNVMDALLSQQSPKPPLTNITLMLSNDLTALPILPAFLHTHHIKSLTLNMQLTRHNFSPKLISFLDALTVNPASILRSFTLDGVDPDAFKEVHCCYEALGRFLGGAERLERFRLFGLDLEKEEMELVEGVDRSREERGYRKLDVFMRE
ncbi:hypothetical protein BC829DRAFT_422797 [Chytridium lagenaria]|nr:hypothetical protein BC829DRAFT_422797 [Chytridium lagenaria]